jgi:hypothetical protein
LNGFDLRSVPARNLDNINLFFAICQEKSIILQKFNNCVRLCLGGKINDIPELLAEVLPLQEQDSPGNAWAGW